MLSPSTANPLPSPFHSCQPPSFSQSLSCSCLFILFCYPVTTLRAICATTGSELCIRALVGSAIDIQPKTMVTLSRNLWMVGSSATKGSASGVPSLSMTDWQGQSHVMPSASEHKRCELMNTILSLERTFLSPSSYLLALTYSSSQEKNPCTVLSHKKKSVRRNCVRICLTCKSAGVWSVLMSIRKDEKKQRWSRE